MFIPVGSASRCPVQSNEKLMTLLYEELQQLDPVTDWHFYGSTELAGGIIEYTFGNSDDDRLASVALVNGVVYDAWVL